MRSDTTPIKHDSLINFDDELISQRLDLLLRANAEIALEKSTFGGEREKIAAALMKKPLPIDKTFALFGLLLGTLPTTAIFIKFVIDFRIFQSHEIWLVGVFAIVSLISAVVGYFSGRHIGKIVFALEKKSWSQMIAAIPFVGFYWGMMAGGAGGMVIFGIGAIFGALIGGLVGAAALSLFSIFHRLLKSGDEIETKHFLLLSFGTTAIIAAFILGL